MHKSITLERVMQAVEDDDNLGFCKACGKEQGCCEPDMRNGECESCDAMQVFGAQELLMEMA